MLIEKIKTDIVTAMKDKDIIKRDLLRTLSGDCCKENKFPDNNKVVSVIKKFIKNIEECLNVANLEQSNKLNKEILILNSYLPKQLSETDLRFHIIQAKINGNKDIGSIMKYLKSKFSNNFDGKRAGEIIKEEL